MPPDPKTHPVTRFPSPNTDLLRFEVIDAAELARRWCVPKSWVADWTRSRAADPIPHYKLGRYVRFAWGSPQLTAWLQRRLVTGNDGTV